MVFILPFLLTVVYYMKKRRQKIWTVRTVFLYIQIVKRKEDYTDIEDICGDIDSTSRHYSYRREPVIYPHEFATLNDILFHTPYGFYRLDKIMPEDMISSKAQETTAPNKSGENVIKGTAVISKSKPED